jgi:probable F420-dependent oxidoreductase
MKYGIAIRNMGPQSSRTTIRACARLAEQAGFDGVFFSDHLCIPPDQTEGSGGRYLDVLATVAYVAGITDKIRIGISVLVLPYRPAVVTAKQIATIQELSGERLIVGVGVGWMKPEFDALGADIRQRGALSDETLDVFHHLFSADVPGKWNGPSIQFPSFVFLPRPTPPALWIGGNGAAARRRVLKFNAGWHPMLPLAQLKAPVEDLKKQAKEAGKLIPEIIVRRGIKFDDVDKIVIARHRLIAEQDAGATYFILDLGRYPDEKSFAHSIEVFMSKVKI